MKTHIVTSYTRAINALSEQGQIKNKIYDSILQKGKYENYTQFHELRERKIGNDQYVILASRKKNDVLNDETFRVDLKKNTILQKRTSAWGKTSKYRQIVRSLYNLSGIIQKGTKVITEYVNHNIVNKSKKFEFYQSQSHRYYSATINSDAPNNYYSINSLQNFRFTSNK